MHVNFLSHTHRALDYLSVQSSGRGMMDVRVRFVCRQRRMC